MKPVVIVQHEADTGPGHFERYLLDEQLPFTVVHVFAGDAMPESAEPYSGICSLGGSMSVNDDLPWIGAELRLMRDADRSGVPVIGHCLGGQLLAKAHGAPVTRNRVREIGWHAVEADDPARVQDWFGDARGLVFFQWHGDTFALPAGARRLLTNPLCANQAFTLERANCVHLAMQFHIEVTPPIVRAWLADAVTLSEIDEERTLNGAVGVQAPDELLEDLDARTETAGVIATKVYKRWARMLRQ